jgi:hypothetical protein
VGFFCEVIRIYVLYIIDIYIYTYARVLHICYNIYIYIIDSLWWILENTHTNNTSIMIYNYTYYTYKVIIYIYMYGYLCLCGPKAGLHLIPKQNVGYPRLTIGRCGSRTWHMWCSWTVMDIHPSFHTRWCPSSLAKLVKITPITWLYGRYTYTWWGL